MLFFKSMKLIQFAVALFLLRIRNVSTYEPTWESLDSRPLPVWYDESKLGIFIHWGVFSVPAFGPESAWLWWWWKGEAKEEYSKFMSENYGPHISYAELANGFNAEFLDVDHWVSIFKESGARYLVLTSKHHEGFTMWPSKVSWNWNAKDVGPKRDLLGDLAAAIRNNTDIHFGVYHSMYEWFHPLYLLDKNNSYKTQYFVHSKTMPELYELVQLYQPEVIWSDGDWDAPDSYWSSKEFLAWLYNESPVKDKVVVNDRWGKDMPCKHGGYYTCQDRYNPKKLQNHKWENAMTIDKASWGFRRNADLADFLTIEDLITELAETVSCGGNLLINVGPTHDGRIVPIFEERLRQLGSWLKVNGEAIYGTTPWLVAQNDSYTEGVWYTSKGNTVYTIVLNWPKNDILLLGSLPVEDTDTITMIGFEQPLAHSKRRKLVGVVFPSLSPDTMPCSWAWVLKMTKPNLGNNSV